MSPVPALRRLVRRHDTNSASYHLLCSVKTYYRPPELPISSYEAPEPHYAGRVHVLTVAGFLHPEMLFKAFGFAKAWTDGHYGNIDDAVSSTNTELEKADAHFGQRRRWMHLSASGFSSSPVKWRSHDPGWGIALGQGRSYEDEVVSSRSQGMGKGGKGIFDGPNKGQGKMNRFQKLRREAEEADEKRDLDEQGDEEEDTESELDGDDGEDDDESMSNSESASSPDDSLLSEDDVGFDAFNQPSKRPAPRTGKQARRKRAKQVKRRGHLRKGHAEREGAVGGSGSEEGWGLILFGRPPQSQAQELAEGQGQSQTEPTSTSSNATVSATATARVIWWENVEGDTRS